MPRFVNPYNFVRFNGVERGPYPKLDKSNSGYIEYTLKTLDPLLIPNTSNNAALLYNDEKSRQEKAFLNGYDFFSYTDLQGKTVGADTYYEPVIPGSQLRGVIRSVYEAAFKSCMSQFDGEQPLWRRSAIAMQPGILKKNAATDEWELYKAKKAMLNTKRNHPDGMFMPPEVYKAMNENEALYCKLSPNVYTTSRNFPTAYHFITEWSKTPKEGLQKGYLHKGNPFLNKKHHESVFFELKQPERIPMEQVVVKRLKELLKVYSDSKINHNIAPKTHDGYKKYKLNEEMTLVYYALDSDGNAQYLAPACLSKEVYRTTLNELAKASEGNYNPCSSRNDICPACALFGMVGNEAVASRVRFADARVADDTDDWRQYYDAPVVLPAMGVPRPSAVEFYTKVPERKPRYWTYDYRVDNAQGDTSGKRTIKTYYPDFKLSLRGRKFYWHGEGGTAAYKDSGRPLDNFATRMRPVKAGKEFSGKIFFENVHFDELERLFWCMTIGANKAYGLKLGRAKPLGFGGVQISDISLHLRMADAEGKPYLKSMTFTEETLQQCIGKVSALENETHKEMGDIRRMMKREPFKNLSGVRVCYPLSFDENKRPLPSFAWFAGKNLSPVGKPEITGILPTVEEEANPNAKHTESFEKRSNNYRNQQRPQNRR